MCHILLKYEWRLMDGQEPKAAIYGFYLAADPRLQLEIRRRQEELDLDNI